MAELSNSNVSIFITNGPILNWTNSSKKHSHKHDRNIPWNSPAQSVRNWVKCFTPRLVSVRRKRVLLITIFVQHGSYSRRRNVLLKTLRLIGPIIPRITGKLLPLPWTTNYFSIDSPLIFPAYDNNYDTPQSKDEQMVNSRKKFDKQDVSTSQRVTQDGFKDGDSNPGILHIICEQLQKCTEISESLTVHLNLKKGKENRIIHENSPCDVSLSSSLLGKWNIPFLRSVHCWRRWCVFLSSCVNSYIGDNAIPSLTTC